MTAEFQSYTKRHYKSWIEFARGKGHRGRDIHPVLVSGFNMTTDFSVVVYPNEDGIPSADNTPFPMFNPPLGDTFEGCWSTHHPIHQNQGLQEPGVSNEPNQCVFIRYWTMRRRREFSLRKEVAVLNAQPASALRQVPSPGDGVAFRRFPARGSATDDTGPGSNIGDQNPQYV